MEENKDFELIKETLQGNKSALSELHNHYNKFIYNLCLKMMYCPLDSADASQEIWIKAITHLNSFEFRSKFSTWLYRIAVNHILNLNKTKMESAISNGFVSYGNDMDNIIDEDLNIEDKLIVNELVEEAKFSCVMGMLLCLSRDQRMAFVLGEVFGFDHKTGSALMDISEDNFRQKLSRARKDISNFTNKRCSLVDENYPCKCRKKTKGFIDKKYIDPKLIKFNTAFTTKVQDEFIQKYDQLSGIKEEVDLKFFAELPYQNPIEGINILENIFEQKELREILNLN